MRIRIFDTTLRDGEQTPGVSLTPDQKLSIAEKLDALGVDAIEAGFPVVSRGEADGVGRIASAGLSCEVVGLARTVQKDLDAAADAGLGRVHMFIATSDIHLRHKLMMTRQQALDAAIDAIGYAKSIGLKIEFSAEDATRTDRAFLKDFFAQVARAGADRVDIPDTVGYSTPLYMAEITRDAVEATGLPVSVHCHNDFGLAVANALSGIGAGASCAHVTVNGIGERAGNASLEELCMALKCLPHNGSYETGIKSELIYETSRYVSKTVGIQVQPNKAIVGDNAFGHESGIHTHGIVNNPLTYEPISPETVGRKRRLHVGKHAGLHGMKAMLQEYGIEPSEGQAEEILAEIKGVGDSGGYVTDVDMLSIADRIMGDGQARSIVLLKSFSTSTGANSTAHACVRLGIDGKEFVETDYGVGQVDAAFRAIQKITGRMLETRISSYRLEGISGGSSSLCEVTVGIEDSQNNTLHAKAIGPDIVATSIRAAIDGINRIMLRRPAGSRPA